MPPKTASNKKPRPGRKARTKKTTEPPARRVAPPYEEDDLLVGGSTPAQFGRCGGRILTSKIEQDICDQLSRHGVTHSHSPRHFEVQLDETSVAAYAPMIVLRGRGREGKTVVVEACENEDKVTLEKIAAFRRQYGVEFYLCFIAPEEVLNEVSIQTYDECAATTEAHTLISRLAD